jgi:2-polyprenyl-3-methyl-5-hydroxy-6-metoxy-1,4-benzoquinol methylase
MNSEPKLRVLVAIASYGVANDRYLSQLVDEYESMSYDVDIVVLSNIHKEVSPGVELVVGLPNKNPWSLPFGHKEIFARRLDAYDLFIYSEDDILITEKNLRAFLRASAVLPENAIAGFLRYERGPDGEVNYPDVHWHFHWNQKSVQSIGEYRFAFFTNEHSASYVMTREQLRKAIDSGGFLVEPHDGDYDLLCTAATDPYTQCGFQKMICISHIDEFLVYHLSNKYVGVQKRIGAHLGIGESQLSAQIAELKNGRNGHWQGDLFQTKTKLKGGMYSKDYYEPVSPEIISAIPASVHSVLSVGCGWGALEAELAAKGLNVVAVPLDGIAPVGVESKGVEIVAEDFDAACQSLAGRQFDCVIFSNILHLVKEPAKILVSFSRLMSPGSKSVIVVPSLSRLAVTHGVARRAANMAHEKLSATYWKMLSGEESWKCWGDFESIGMHYTSHNTVRSWCEAAGLKVDSIVDCLPHWRKPKSGSVPGLLDRVRGLDIFAVAEKA